MPPKLTAVPTEAEAEAAPHTAELWQQQMLQFQSRLMAGYEQCHRRVGDLCDTLSARLEQAEGVAVRYLELQLKVAEEREELLSRRAEREAVHAIAKAREAAIADMARDLRSLLPVVGKKLLGVPLTGDDSHGLQDLLGTLSGEQIDDVMSKGELKLSQSQRALLASVLGSLAGEGKTEATE